jgi:hypothetical protein
MCLTCALSTIRLEVSLEILSLVGPESLCFTVTN